MERDKTNLEITLTIPIPKELETLKIIGGPSFLQIREGIDKNNRRILEIVCSEPRHFSKFEAFSDLVETNVRKKRLPALSVFLNALRVWDWEETRKIA